jgi:hypothetical protein
VSGYPRSMKWRTYLTHPHARDTTADAPAAIPSLRNRSLCPFCNKTTSIEVESSQLILMFGV